MTGLTVQALGIRVPPGLGASSIAAAVGRDERVPTLDGAWHFCHVEMSPQETPTSIPEQKGAHAHVAIRETSASVIWLPPAAVETQLSGPRMTLGAWAAYFGTPAAQRPPPLLNVVSLQLAGTPLQARGLLSLLGCMRAISRHCPSCRGMLSKAQWPSQAINLRHVCAKTGRSARTGGCARN